MPTLQELIDERRKKRQAELAAQSVIPTTPVPDTIDLTPQIKASEAQTGLDRAYKLFGVEKKSEFRKWADPVPVPGREPGMNVETLVNVAKTPIQAAEGLAHQAKDAAVLGIGGLVPISLVLPQFREQYKQSMNSIAQMPKAMAQPILDAFTGAGLNPMAGGLNPVIERFKGKNAEEVKKDYPEYGKALERLSLNPIAPTVSAAGAVAGGQQIMAPRPTAMPKASEAVTLGEVEAPSTALQTNRRMGYRATAVADPLKVTPGVSPRVATALRTTAGGRAKAGIGDYAHRVANGAREAFEYEHTLSDFPELQNEMLVFKSTLPNKVVDMSRKVLVSNLENLDRSSYLQFQDMVNLRNHRMTALRQIAEGKPVKLPNGMTLDEVTQAIQAMEPQMAPAARQALEAHGNLVMQIGQDLVNRGVIPKESLSAEYFPNQVMSYLGERGDFLASGGKRLKVPYRGYGQKRQGSELPVETDYRRVMLKYLTAYATDNATVDFLGRQVQKYDIGPTLAVVDENGISRIPRNAIPDGYKEFVPQSANIVRGPKKYPIDNPTPLEQAMMDAMDTAGDDGPYVRPDAAVLPAEIADRFQNFGSETTPSIMKAVNKATGLWKAITIVSGGAKFTVFQLMGDALNLFREDARAFLSAPKALKQQFDLIPQGVGFPKRGPGGPLFKRAADQAVVGSGFVGKEIPDVLLSTPELARLGSPWEKLQSAIYQYNPLKFNRDFQIDRENFLRFTKFVADMDRGVEVSKAGKAAREFTVDYNKFTPQENTYLRGGLAPFYAFAKQNTINWTKYVANHPSEAALKFAAPYYAASLWNETKHPGVDDKIPPWMKDQFYLIVDSNDSTATVLTFATPLDDAFRKFGVAHPRKLMEQMLNTQLPGMAADTTLPTGMAALKEVPREAALEWGNLLSPAVKLPIELASNWSMFTDRPIEREGERTLPDSLKTQTKEKYAVGSLFRPYREVSLYSDAFGSEKEGQALSRFLPVYKVDLKNPFAGKEFVNPEEVFNQMLRAMESGDDAELNRLFMRYGGTLSPSALQRYLTLYQIQMSKAQQPK